MPNTLPPHRQRDCPTCATRAPGQPAAKLTTERAQQCHACYCWSAKRDAAKRRGDLVSAPPPTEIAPPASTLFDEQWDTFCKYIGRSKPATPAKARPAGRTVTIAHLSDCHAPYTHEAAFQWALEDAAGADIGVIGGDLFNGGAFSRFIERRFESPRNDLAAATMVLQAAASAFPRVIVNKGNHNDRVRKYFSSRIPPYMMFLVHSDITTFIVEGLRREHGITNIEVARPIIADLETSDWLALVGDCAFTHAESHSKISTRPAENVARFLHRWRAKLPTMPNVIVQEHNHRAAKVPSDELNALLIQAPALSDDQDYQFDSSLRYGPNQIGYTRIVQVDGVSVWNRCDYQLWRDAARKAA